MTIGIETGIKIEQVIVIVMALVMLNTVRIMSPIQRERMNTKMSKRKPKMSTGHILMIHIHIETRTLIVMSTQRRKSSTKEVIILMAMIIMINKGTESTIQMVMVMKAIAMTFHPMGPSKKDGNILSTKVIKKVTPTKGMRSISTRKVLRKVTPPNILMRGFLAFIEVTTKVMKKVMPTKWIRSLPTRNILKKVTPPNVMISCLPFIEWMRKVLPIIKWMKTVLPFMVIFSLDWHVMILIQETKQFILLHPQNVRPSFLVFLWWGIQWMHWSQKTFGTFTLQRTRDTSCSTKRRT